MVTSSGCCIHSSGKGRVNETGKKGYKEQDFGAFMVLFSPEKLGECGLDIKIGSLLYARPKGKQS